MTINRRVHIYRKRPRWLRKASPRMRYKSHDKAHFHAQPPPSETKSLNLPHLSHTHHHYISSLVPSPSSYHLYLPSLPTISTNSTIPPSASTSTSTSTSTMPSSATQNRSFMGDVEQVLAASVMASVASAMRGRSTATPQPPPCARGRMVGGSRRPQRRGRAQKQPRRASASSEASGDGDAVTTIADILGLDQGMDYEELMIEAPKVQMQMQAPVPRRDRSGMNVNRQQRRNHSIGQPQRRGQSH